MDSIFDDKELEAKTSRSSIVFGVIAFAAILVVFIYDQKSRLLDFQANKVNIIIFFCILLVWIFWCIKLLDRKPQLLIDNEGIRHRQSILPFSGINLIRWTDIYFVYLLEKTQKNVTGHYLVIRLNTDKEKRIELNGLDKSLGRVLSIVQRYAKKYSIQFLDKQID